MWILLWSSSFTLTVAISRFLHGSFSEVSLVFFRCLFALFFTLPVFLKQNAADRKFQQKRMILLRGVLFYGALICTYYGYRRLPLAVGCSVGFSGPFITTCLAALILHEYVSPKKWLCVLGGYVGVWVIAHPDGITINLPVYILLLGNVLLSFMFVVTRVLSQNNTAVTVLHYTNIGGLFLSFITVFFQWQTPSLPDLMVMITMGATASFSQYCYIRALQVAEASTVAPYEYSRLAFSIPLGFFLFSEIPSFSTLLGVSIIIVMTIWLWRLNQEDTAKA